MEENHNGQQRQARPERDPVAVTTLRLAAAVVIVSGCGLLVMGLTSALTNGYKVGAYAAFGGGLAAAIIGTILVHGGTAMICYRLQLRDNALTRAELRETNALIHAELRETNQNLRIAIALLKAHVEEGKDQVRAARRSREN